MAMSLCAIRDKELGRRKLSSRLESPPELIRRKGRSQLISSAFQPLIGKHASGPGGKVIDILAIFATLFGSAASLGLGRCRSGPAWSSTGGSMGSGRRCSC